MRPALSARLRGAALYRPAVRFSSSFRQPPSPLKLPPDQQAEFERLQHAAATAATSLAAHPPPASSDEAGEASRSGAIFKAPPPEFKGNTNPRTGEVGGPKNEPLRWGAGGDWSYNGRVTDF